MPHPKIPAPPTMSLKSLFKVPVFVSGGTAIPNGNPPGGMAVPPETNTGTLNKDFSDMVGGAGIFGCGIESQLESWYRFLVQPDPYASLAQNSSGSGVWSGVDTMILKQRKDFLRPDSLVAVIVLSDENDSEIDVRSLGGKGYLFMHGGFNPPRGTGACSTNPGDPGCVSCSVNGGDPNCSVGGGSYTARNDWGFDMNLRHVHMKAKYGVDAQYPVWRYAVGLSSTVVPDRNGEYTDGNGNSVANYLGRTNCTNPVFAASLPDGSVLDVAHLCTLPVGPRTKDMVF